MIGTTRSSTFLTIIGFLASMNSLMKSKLLRTLKAFPHSLQSVGSHQYEVCDVLEGLYCTEKLAHIPLHS